MAEEKQTEKIEVKKTEKKTDSTNLIVLIRIAGQVKVIGDVKNTLERLRLRKKYSCVVLKPTKDILGMIKKIRYHVAFGNIDKKTLIELIKARGKTLDKSKVNPEDKASSGSKAPEDKASSGSKAPEDIAEDLISGKKLKDLGLKPFFSLHPPRKGIKSKLQYPKGVLGDNKADINKLIERML